MIGKNQTRSGTTWGRTLSALAVVAVPVISITGFSGVVQAGVAPEVTAEVVCGKQGAFIDIEISGGQSEKFSVVVDTETVISQKSPGYINGSKILNGELVDGDTYLVEVFNELPSYEFNPSFLLEADCSGVEISCTNPRNPMITVVTPNGGSGYDVYLLSGDVEVDFDLLPIAPVDLIEDVDPESEATLEAGGDGIFTVVFDGSGEGRNNSYFVVEVDCLIIPDIDIDINVPNVTTPVIPKTGTDSTTTMLVIAPMMVLLGGALIVARRRLANA